MEEKLTQRLNLAIGAVFILAAGVLVYMAVTRQAKGDDGQTSSATSTEQTMPAETADQATQGMKKLVLASNFESWTPEAKVTGDKTVSKKIVIKGAVTKAFLLVKASEGQNGLTKWDSFFFKLNDAGGHLFRPLSLPVQAGENTTLLYNLTDVAVLPSVPYDENRTPEHAELLSLLKDGKTVNVTSFISNVRQSSIDELAISYACKEGSDCSIDIK